MSLHPRRRSLRFQIVTVVWLTIIWLLLWGDLSPANLLAGAAVAVLVTRSMPMPPIEFHGTVHLPSVLYLAYRFVVDLVIASFQVSLQALTPGKVPRGAVLAVQLRSHSDLYLTLTAELCSLVPGSIVVEAQRTSGMLYVHVLDVELSGGIERARHHVLDTEARILRAIASDAELTQAGLARNPRSPAPRRGDPIPPEVRR
ncbi:Na+/H+ antiporter subunit E [Actinotalea sp. K2]|uniref:Na+/H+ antiporter subunit E n=1 Tax=Actinotalea sp. K2 TaxID=2939438 RepID=UPI002017D3EC|nr:Na+/H+ antiporter subunit E [Actinotalea sp. K2]MCL3861763.1 Na+/H+ antiporter subunit E [Actinotalea sp. K2]